MRGERGKLWQKQFFEHIIDDEVDLKGKIRYIYENPVRSTSFDTQSRNYDTHERGNNEGS